MKKLFFLLALFYIIANSANAQIYNPFFHDEAKYYQWRSIEDGPWKLRPKWYYTVFHWKYRKRHNPDRNTRLAITGASLLEKDRYEKQAEEVNSWKNREIKLSADRAIDLVLPTVNSRLDDAKKTFLDNMTTYTKIADREDIKIGTSLMSEYNRILENKRIISKTYIENSKRQIAYNKVIKDMDELNTSLVGFIKLAYSKKINKDFISKNKLSIYDLNN